MIITKERIAKWDNVKFILILLVVVGHVVGAYTENSPSAKSLFLFIYLFHMPAFIFLAGLFGKRTVQEKRYDKILGYFVLFLGMKILIFTVRKLIGQRPLFELFSEGGVSWFIFAIAIFYLVTIVLKRYSPKYIFPVIISLACFVGYDKSIGDFLVLSRIIVYYPFFYLGYCLSADDVLNLVRRREMKIMALIILCTVALVCIANIDAVYWLRPLLTGRNSYEKLVYYSEYGCFLRLAWYFVSGTVVLAFITVIPEQRFGFTILGSRTLQVYALHRPVLFVWEEYHLDSIMQIIWPVHWKVLMILLGVVLTFVLSSKIFSKPFDFILHPISK